MLVALRLYRFRLVIFDACPFTDCLVQRFSFSYSKRPTFPCTVNHQGLFFSYSNVLPESRNIPLLAKVVCIIISNNIFYFNQLYPFCMTWCICRESSMNKLNFYWMKIKLTNPWIEHFWKSDMKLACQVFYSLLSESWMKEVQFNKYI